ncbi:MAG: NTP transferase domain-containing protein [Acidobacteriota bacterium]|nr:NTP transferase domain-containing protein [Acidobacteriota bacterium]
MSVPSAGRGGATGGTSRVAVVLAAGRGTRMELEGPKVLARASGLTLVERVVAIARELPCERVVVIVGHGGDEVRGVLAADDVEFVVQEDQLGTGHALACAESVVAGDSIVFVLSGDVPLLRARTLRELGAAAAGSWGAMAVADLDEPGSLGRVVTDNDGYLVQSVEFADATAAELEVRTVNAGIYALPAAGVFDYLRRVRPDNAQGEIYLPDALNLAAADGLRVRCLHLEDPDEALGVNTPGELAEVDRLLRAREASG